MLSSDLQLALLQKIANSWREINRLYFKDGLKLPVFTFEGPSHMLGSFQLPGTMYLNLDLVLYNDWKTAVIPTLKHEMAHQYIMEKISPVGNGHDQLFRKICAQIGAAASATGNIKRQTDTEQTASQSPNNEPNVGDVVRKIQKLLNLAQSQNQHEAEAAMTLANSLLLKFNLDHGLLAQTEFARRNVSTHSKRTPIEFSLICNILQEFYFVEIVFFKDWDELGLQSQQCAIMGKQVNVEIAEYTLHFLMAACERYWQDFRRDKKKTIVGRERRSFVIGLMEGFQQKLSDQRRINQTQGLVWKGDPELIRFAKNHFPRTARTSYSRQGDASVYAAGKAAGATLIVHKGMHGQGSQSRGLLSSGPGR
jgi:Protein of unknown function (DUF2786)